MHDLRTLARLNSGVHYVPHPLRLHPRIYTLRRQVVALPVSGEYRYHLLLSLHLYADQIVARPKVSAEDGWDDLEALQQVTLGDMLERSLKTSWRKWQ